MKKSKLLIMLICMQLGMQAQSKGPEIFTISQNKVFTEKEIFDLAKDYPNAQKGIFNEDGTLKEVSEFILYVEKKQDVHKYLKRQEEFYEMYYMTKSFVEDRKYIKTLDELINLYDKYNILFEGRDSDSYREKIDNLKTGKHIAYIDKEGGLVIVDVSQVNPEKLEEVKKDNESLGRRELKKAIE